MAVVLPKFADEDFIKSVMNFDPILDKKWFETLQSMSYEESVSDMKWRIHDLQIALKAVYIVIESQMKQTNKINKIISKLPDDEKYQELKKTYDERDNDIEETIRPLSDYTKELEESRKKRPGYIG